MNEPRKKNPTTRVAVLIVVVVGLVIATVLYNAITEKREFDRENAPDTTSSAASSAAATGASGTTATSGSAAQ
jgi:hypothetical protein